MEVADTPFAEIEASFEALRRAVEERNYPALDITLQDQRRLMSEAPPADPRTQTLALKGSALIAWALTMVKIQHAGYAHELAAALNANHLLSQYLSAGKNESKHIFING